MDRKEKIVRAVAAAVFAAVATACCDSAPVPETSSETETADCTIAALRGFYYGETRLVESDITVAGRVTTSDSAGNFYKSLVIEDSTGAVEIMAGVTDLATSFPEGVTLSVDLRGCALGQSYGVMQIGLYPAPYSGYATDYFSSRALLDSHVKRGGEVAVVEPYATTVAGLDRAMCGRLVRIDALTLQRPAGDDEYTVPARWSGYATFKDAAGDSVVVYTRPYADYADLFVPVGEVSLTGILQYGRSGGSRECYQLKMRHVEDCRPY